MAPLLRKVATFSFVSLLHLIFIIPSTRLLLKQFFQSHTAIVIFLASLVVLLLLLFDKLESEPKEKLLLDCFALVLFLFFSRQISVAFLLLLVGFWLGKRVCPKILFYTLFSTIPLLHLAPYKRFEFLSMDANYTAYFFYLISMPFFLKLLVSEDKQENKMMYIPLIVISNLLAASRGVLLSIVIAVCVRFKKIRISLGELNAKKILLISLMFFLASIFVGKHLTDSVDERVYIYSEVLHGRVLGLTTGNFNEIHIAHCAENFDDEFGKFSMLKNTCIKSNPTFSSRPFGFISLHNTLLTWFFVSPLMFFFFYGYLYWKFGQNFVLLSIPTVFLSVGPGLFYLYLGLSLGSATFKVGK